MKKKKLQRGDSIRKLAAFWDRHDLTEFADELEEVRAPVFEGRGAAIRLRLPSSAAQALRRIAKSKGVSQAQLIRDWIQRELVSDRNKRERRKAG